MYMYGCRGKAPFPVANLDRFFVLHRRRISVVNVIWFVQLLSQRIIQSIVTVERDER